MLDIWQKIFANGLIFSFTLIGLIGTLQHVETSDIWKKILLSALAVSLSSMVVAALCAVWF